MTKRLAIFDFCNTLVDFETADEFVRFSSSQLGTEPSHLEDLTRKILYKVRLIGPEDNKRWTLSCLKGTPEAQLLRCAQEFVQKRVTPQLIRPVMDRLEEHKRRGDHIVILSGGYKPYLDVFATEHQINDVVATRIEIKDGICTGNIDGDNCMGTNKVRLLRSALDLSRFDLQEASFYTDHPSDLPVLEIVGKGIIVSHSEARPSWAPLSKSEVIHV